MVIVDGIETSGGSRLGDDNSAEGVNGNLSGWESINPQDIESISILKDASATAVYGVRGANGVIIITTKKGRTGKPQVNYSGSFSLSRPLRLTQAVNAVDYIAYNREGNYNDGVASIGEYSFDRYNRFKYNYNPILYPSLDMNDYLLRDFAPKHEHNVSVRGGTDFVRYYTSLGYYDESGIIKDLKGFPFNPNQTYNRFSLRTNLDFQFTKRLSVGLNIDLRMENRGGTSGALGNLAATDARFFQFLHMAKPWITPGFDEEGRYIQSYVPETTSPQIIEQIMKGGVYKLRQITSNNLLSAKHELDFITPGLSVQAKYSLNTYSYNNGRRYLTLGMNQYYVPMEIDNEVVYRVVGDPSTIGYQSLGSGKATKEYFEASLNYQRTFGKHDVTALFLYNQDKTSYNVATPADVPHAYLGYVTRVTYAFNSRYLAEFNMGINGSENFPEGKRFGVFPAYSLGWVISQEKFMENVKFVDFLKIRGSYGTVGADGGGGRFIYIDGVFTPYPDGSGRLGYYSNFGDQTRITIPALQEGKVANPNVTWAKAKKTNIGIEGNLFNERLKFTFDYFDEKRTDIITYMQDQPLYLFPSGLAGFTNPYDIPANYNETATNGYEISLGWADRIGKNFSYYVNGSFSYARTKLTKITEPMYDYPWMYAQGQYMGQIKGLVADGYWNSYEEINNPNNPYNTYGNNPIPGDIKYKDINGDMQIDSKDQIYIGYGNTQPPKNFTVDLGFNYKNFEMSVLFQGATGMLFAPSGSSQILMGSGKAIYDWIADRWTPTNRDGTYPVLHSGAANVESASNFQPSTFWAYDATYVRLKNLVIAYNLPSKIMDRIKLENIRISFSAQNLATWNKDKRMDNYDPEMVSSGRTLYPIMAIYSLGLNITF